MHIGINAIMDLLLCAVKLFYIFKVHWLLFLPPAVTLKVSILLLNVFGCSVQ